jgi:Ca2+/Na+ antiporter
MCFIESDNDEDDDEDEKEEMPEDIKDLSPDEQQRRIKWRAAYMMGLGSLILLIVSDPMVTVLGELGNRTGIPPFYIAFVAAPLASNASELIAAYNYAQKKTATSISIALTTLEGAAVMNNTFVLGKSSLFIYDFLGSFIFCAICLQVSS